MQEKKKNNTKKWWIIIASALILVVLGLFLFNRTTTSGVFTKAEYIKEVVVQNEQFESVLDNFLDQVSSYNGSKAATEKLNNTASKFTDFVNELEKNLGPRVPLDSKQHYDEMISAYKLYLEAIEAYRTSVPKNLGEERNTLIAEAKKKLEKAQEAMKNIQ